MNDKPKVSFPIFASYKNKLKPKRSQAQLAISQVEIFSRMSWREIRIIEHAVHTRTYTPKEPIFKQGDPGSGMYIIVHGRVGLFFEVPNQEPTNLPELGEGDFFGEIALLDDSPRSASATALDNCTILGFYRPDLMEILKTKPALGNKILLSLSEVLATRLRGTNSELLKLKRLLEELDMTEDHE